MPLFIRNAEVDALAEEVRRVTKVKTKTEAVRGALEARLIDVRRNLPLAARLARSRALADAMGCGAPDFDMKAFTDEMWGDA